MSQVSQTPSKKHFDFKERFPLVEKEEKITDWFLGTMIVLSLFTGIVSLIIGFVQEITK